MYEKFPTLPKRHPKAITHDIPFGNLEIGESFIVPKEKAKSGTIISAAHRYAKRNKIKLTTSIVMSGVCISRIK